MALPCGCCGWWRWVCRWCDWPKCRCCRAHCIWSVAVSIGCFFKARSSGFGWQRSGGVADHRRARRDIMGHNSARADDGSVANGDARQNDRPATDPDVIADGNGLAPFHSGRTALAVARPILGQQLYSGPELAAGANADFADIHEKTAVIDKAIRPEMDVFSVIDVEGRADYRPVPGAQKLRQRP